ncbi:MAG: hypothetical protein HGA31_05200 [Candidatus Moranbacteria bacterium]|nr:hypothetical protein [Candidatus Moranbacteria bacterium]
MKCISKTLEFEERLRREGKITYLDEPKHIAVLVKMNERLRKAREEYLRREHLSWFRAKNIRLR